MQGRDGEPPEVVRACGRAGGNGGGVGCRWLEWLRLEEEEKEAICRGERDVHGGLLQMQWWLAGGLGNTWLAAAGRGRKGSNLQRGERRSWWLITDAMVAGRWSWQHMVGSGWKRKKRKQSAEGRETFMVAYYRCNGGWPVVLATHGGAGCSGREEETLTAEEERRRSRRRKSATGRSKRGERRGVCSTTGKRLLVQEKGFYGGYGGGKTSDGVLPVVAAVEGERKTEKQRKWQKPGRG
jgi:hypothetical protein